MGSSCTLLRPGVVPYDEAWRLQQRLAAGVRDGAAPVLVLLQHPPTYTLGVRGKTEHLLLSQEQYLARGASVQRTDRGGDVTFHGPGQIVGYPILDLRRFGLGPVAYVRGLEAMLADVLSRYGIVAARRDGQPGVWVGAEKIAAIGVRISRGVTTHGFALNVNTDLRYFRDIVPCGIADAGVTSMQRLAGEACDLDAVEEDVVDAFARRFGVDPIEQRATAEVSVGA